MYPQNTNYHQIHAGDVNARHKNRPYNIPSIPFPAKNSSYHASYTMLPLFHPFPIRVFYSKVPTIRKRNSITESADSLIPFWYHYKVGLGAEVGMDRSG